MYNRKEIKKNARGIVKRGYWLFVMVCFIMAILTSAYAGSVAVANAYDANNETTEAVQNEISYNDNLETLNQLYAKLMSRHQDASELEVDLVIMVFQAVAAVTSTSSSMMTFLRLLNASSNGTAIIIITLLGVGILLSFAYNIFVQGVLLIGEKRVFIESRACPNVSVGRLFMPWRYRVVRRFAWISLKKWIFLTLWSFTIIGGFIKTYEYAQVEYIAAENPSLTAKEVFKLSKKMMRGNKWHLFVLDLSMLGWQILSMLTLGLLGIFYVNPYITAVRTEFYVWRRDSLDEQGKLALCDAQLAAYLGDAPYDDNENSVFVLGAEKRAHRPIHADRKYTVQSLILLFFFFSFVGWAWEVSLHLFKEGVFVNRGTMFGPWLPIYGSGGVLIILTLRRFMKNVPLTFLMAMVVCGTVEYFTSWFLEVTKGIKWWDYSGYFMNLNGRICLEGLLVFGLGGCAFLYFIAPRVDDVIKKIPLNVQTTLCVILCLFFGADTVYSQFHPNTGKGITDYPTKEQIAQSLALKK